MLERLYRNSSRLSVGPDIFVRFLLGSPFVLGEGCFCCVAMCFFDALRTNSSALTWSRL